MIPTVIPVSLRWFTNIVLFLFDREPICEEAETRLFVATWRNVTMSLHVHLQVSVGKREIGRHKVEKEIYA